MHFRPLHDRVLVRRIDAEEKTAGGIIIPTPQRKSRRRARSSPRALAQE
jgi:chaperonin GroES